MDGILKRILNSSDNLPSTNKQLTRVVVLGSVNVDNVYTVKVIANQADDFSFPALKYQRYLGGKGLNQARALTLATKSSPSLMISFYGNIANDSNGCWVKHQLGQKAPELLKNLNVISYDSSETGNECTGHVIVQQPQDGSHPVSFLWNGCNRLLPIWLVDEAIGVADVLVLQNECSQLQYILESINQINKDRELPSRIRVLLNPAPIIPVDLPLHCYRGINWLVVNLSELHSLLERCGLAYVSYGQSLRDLLSQLQLEMIILTMGSEGSMACCKGITNLRPDPAKQPEEYEIIKVPACKPLKGVVDPVGAGDCFIGYFLAFYLQDDSNLRTALDIASVAASIEVERQGAFDGIPSLQEVHERILKYK